MASVKWYQAIVYIDDTIILLQTTKQELNHIEEVLRLLRDAGMTIKLMKLFFRKTVDGARDRPRETPSSIEDN